MIKRSGLTLPLAGRFWEELGLQLLEDLESWVVEGLDRFVCVV